MCALRKPGTVFPVSVKALILNDSLHLVDGYITEWKYVQVHDSGL